MLNILWALMVIVGILYGAFTGSTEAVSEAALSSAQDAVELCVSMTGVVGLWMGMTEIARQSGLIARLTAKTGPFVRFLFPRIPAGHPALEYISANIIANVLGLGWACTPAGLKAMEALAQLEAERGTPGYRTEQETGERCGIRVASNEMCTFLIINISSLQLIPLNMIAYRQQYGSVNPSAIIAPAILSTFLNTIAAIVFCKLIQKKNRKL